MNIRKEISEIESVKTQVFENVYTSAGRQQTLLAVAERLTPDRFPAAQTADIVHLAPIAQEVDLGWLNHFPGALIGVTPQGWLRQWDAQGSVSPTGWAEAAEVLPRADVVIISSEDVAHDEALNQHTEHEEERHDDQRRRDVPRLQVDLDHRLRRAFGDEDLG